MPAGPGCYYPAVPLGYIMFIVTGLWALVEKQPSRGIVTCMRCLTCCLAARGSMQNVNNSGPGTLLASISLALVALLFLHLHCVNG